MNKFIFLFLIITGCVNKEKASEKVSNFNIIQTHISDNILNEPGGTFEKVQLIQFHIYYDGVICGYVNCMVRYEDMESKELSSIKLMDIMNNKGLINKAELIQDECNFDLKVWVGRNFHSLSFVYENCNRILLDSTDEVSIESLSKRNSGIRVAKGEPPFIQVVYK